MDLSESISSQGSEGGITRLSSQDGQLEGRSGQEAAHVSHSAEQGRCGEKPMKDTSGQRCGGSLESADLQRSLESRLRANLGANGSMEYSLTWKQWAIGSREPICALRASGHRTSDKDYTGWRSPDASQRGSTYQDPEKVLRRIEAKHQVNLEDQAVLAGWPTPNCADVNASRSSTPQAYSKRWMERENHGSQLAHTAQALVGWPTCERERLQGFSGDGNRGCEPGRVGSQKTGSAGAGSATGWDGFDIIPCYDGKQRRIESGTFPLAHGIPRGVVPDCPVDVAYAKATGEARKMRLKGYGNAIVPQVAAAFIRAFIAEA
jgi:hypothetical protein